MSRRLCVALVALSALFFTASYCLYCRALQQRREPARSIDVVEVVVDTLRYEAIEPIRVVASPRDTAPALDSIYTFRDTVEGRWSAEVEGRDVELRKLEIIDREEHHHHSPAPPTWDVALKARVDPYTQWVGVGVSRNFGRLTLSLDSGYDIRNRAPYVGAQASFSIWRD